MQGLGCLVPQLIYQILVGGKVNAHGYHGDFIVSSLSLAELQLIIHDKLGILLALIHLIEKM